jgi:hypothetical protein
MLDLADTGFLVNTGKQLILVDAGAGTWWGGGAMGRSSNLLCPLPNNRKAFTSAHQSVQIWTDPARAIGYTFSPFLNREECFAR